MKKLPLALFLAVATSLVLSVVAFASEMYVGPGGTVGGGGKCGFSSLYYHWGAKFLNTGE